MAIVTIENIETKVRNLLGDNSENSSDFHTYENSSIFSLQESNVQTVNSVLRNNGELTETTHWIYNSSTNKVSISSTLVNGDSIEIQYTYYPNYSQNEINSAIKAALYHISINDLKDWEVLGDDNYVEPTPNIREQNLITIIAGLILDPDNKSYRLPDINVIAPNDDPLHTKIRKVIGAYKNNKAGIFDIVQEIPN